MLQQTRVDTVIPYYRRFLTRFPTVKRLADAPLDDVFAVWSGLGYYRRARFLWLAAREVCDKYGGRLPGDVESLRALPGVGRYTAGAVASIAFDVPAPIVDGNVTRVLCRVCEIDGDPAAASTQRRVWEEASRLVPDERPGWFNQALMELGASVCRPKGPACSECPVRSHCGARRSDRVSSLPAPVRRKAPRAERLVAVVLTNAHGVLMAQRSVHARFGGLWEPPTLPATTSRQVRQVLCNAGLDMTGVRLRRMGQLKHVLTHRILEVSVFRGGLSPSMLRSVSRVSALESGDARYQRIALRAHADAGVGASTLARRVLSASVAT